MGLRAPKIFVDEQPDARADGDDDAILEQHDVLNTLEREYLDEDDGDPLRGIGNGILGGAALWAALIAMVILLT